MAITAEKAIAAALGLAREQDWMPAILCMATAQQLEGQLVSVGTIQRKFAGWGYHLERSLICLCLDRLIDEGLIKILPPDDLA